MILVLVIQIWKNGSVGASFGTQAGPSARLGEGSSIVLILKIHMLTVALVLMVVLGKYVTLEM